MFHRHVWKLNGHRWCLHIGSDSPDEPPALQVLLDDLHSDPFLKADLILPLTGVGLQRHIFLLCSWSKLKQREKRDSMRERLSSPLLNPHVMPHVMQVMPLHHW